MKTKQLNKVRDMTGSRMGCGSAGRANGSYVEKRITPVSSALFTGYGDVGMACHRWLMAHDPAYRKQREFIKAADLARNERRELGCAGGGQ